jgi:hypothetical protein
MTRTRTVHTLVVALLIVGAPAGDGLAQPAPASVRLALVRQWVLDRNDLGPGTNGRGSAADQFARALERGIVDRPTFGWDRDHIARSTLLPKPVRVVSGAEATALGGRGEFTLVAVRPPAGASAWTEVVVAPGAPGDEAVLVLEVGGEDSTVAQVLESILLAPDRGGVERLPLAPRALFGRQGVPVIRAARGQPISSSERSDLRGADGVTFLVVRSPVDVLADGATTTSGRADLAWDPSADWRVGDRLFIRVPLTRLRNGAPGIVLAWKDRIVHPPGQASR